VDTAVNDVIRDRKRPAFQFYPGDWRRDTALQTCSLAARGIWIEMICLMHEGEPYGHLRVGAKTISLEVLARMVGEPCSRVRQLIAELEDAGVCSRREDGTLFSRRMVRDEHTRNARAEGGKASLNHPTVAARLKDRPKGDAEDGSKDTRRDSLLPTSDASFTPSPASASSSASASSLAQVRPASPQSGPPTAQRKRPIFTGQRLVVFEWQVDDLTRMLGDHTDGFDLRAWFDALDQQACDSCLVIPQRDSGVWLQAQTLQEAQRRGLPIAVAPTTAITGRQTSRLASALARIRAGERT
jgi:hypothetical protein